MGSQIVTVIGDFMLTGKRWLRGLIKVIAAVAVLVLVFVNRVTSAAGLMMLGSLAVLVICLLAWWKLDLGEDRWFSPRKPDR
jgi:hypothetical protein